MSHRLISLNEDLKRLRDEGYNIEIRSGYLLLKDIPYVNANKEIRQGTLVAALTTSGDKTMRPKNHVMYFAGDYPCEKDGSPIPQIRHQSQRRQLDIGLDVDHAFSAKPSGGYKDFYEKMTTYANLLSAPAEAIDPSVTGKTFPVFEAREEESVFNYIDTASSRAGINLATRKLEVGKVAIIGLGGTGSYVFDLIAKTPTKEIHLFDKDRFLSHNAFRSPGAASLEELDKQPTKVSYFRDKYIKMRRRIFAYEYDIDESNVNQLREMNFVFICIDKGGAKKIIVEALEEYGVSFIDVGAGIQLVNSSLAGQLRITLSTPTKRNHVREMNRIAFSDGEAEEEYDQNIQIADLNALNAALAVIKWKKLIGFYTDFEKEHNILYVIDGNTVINEDQV